MSYDQAHRSIQTEFIIKRVYGDDGMLIFSPLDPFNEFINLSLSQESDRLKDKFINEVSYSFNPQTCDLNEPSVIFTVMPPFPIPDPPNIYGINTIGTTEDTIALEVFNDMDSFYQMRPTRLVYDDEIIYSFDDDVNGIMYAHSADDRIGTTYVIFDTNPGEYDALGIFKESPFECSQSGYPLYTSITDINTYVNEYYKIPPDDIDWDVANTGAGYYKVPFNILGEPSVYDLSHLNHSNEPILLDSNEVAMSGEYLVFNEYINGRPSYNPNYYDSPSQSGQPMQYWNGIYGMQFSYTPITEVNTGLATDGYFHKHQDDGSGLIFPNNPKETDIAIPYEEALTDSTYDMLFRINPMYVRPGSDVTVVSEYTKKIETTWSDVTSTFTYTISDSDFDYLNEESVSVKVDTYTMNINVTISGNSITIDPIDSTYTDVYGTSNYDVTIYYKVKNTQTITTVASYTFTSTNFADDYAVTELGDVIPFSMVPLTLSGVGESYAYPKFSITTKYDLKGLTYEPYRKVFISIENNNKYLTMRSTKDLSIITNYSLYKNTKYRYIEIDGISHRLIDYTPQYSYNFTSVKYFDKYLYLLSTNGILYILHSLDDFNKLDFRFDTSGNYEYTPIALSNTSNPIDFTFDRDANIIVAMADGTFHKYIAYRDYCIIDKGSNIIYTIEKYDQLAVDDEPRTS